ALRARAHDAAGRPRAKPRAALGRAGSPAGRVTTGASPAGAPASSAGPISAGPISAGPNPPEGLDRPLQVLGLEGRGHLDADSRCSLRNHRKAEAGDEDPFLEQPLRE